MCITTKMSFGLVVYGIEYAVTGPGFDSHAHPLLILRKKNFKNTLAKVLRTWLEDLYK